MKRGSAAFSARMRSSVPSVEPSSTNSTDQAKSCPSRLCASSATSASSPAASLRTGMTRVISGRSEIMAARAIARFMPFPKPPRSSRLANRAASGRRRPCEVPNNGRRRPLPSPGHTRTAWPPGEARRRETRFHGKAAAAVSSPTTNRVTSSLPATPCSRKPAAAGRPPAAASFFGSRLTAAAHHHNQYVIYAIGYGHDARRTRPDLQRPCRPHPAGDPRPADGGRGHGHGAGPALCHEPAGDLPASQGAGAAPA